MGAFALISQGLSAINSWIHSFNYNGIPMGTIIMYVFIGAMIVRFILPLFIPQFSWRSKSDSSDSVRNK